MRQFGDNSQPICLARQTRGCDCSSHHSLERKGQQQWPLRAQDRSEPLAWALLTHRSILDPSTETAWKREMVFGIPYSPASPSWLSHFPTSSSLSILCFWYHKILLKERGHYQTVKHSVRTFLSSKVKFPLSTVQILQSVLSAPGPKYCGVCGAGECQTSHCHQQLLETFCIHSNGCEIWLNPHRKIKNDWKKNIKTPNQTQMDQAKSRKMETDSYSRLHYQAAVHSLERQEPAARYSVNSPIHHRHGGIFSNFIFLSFLQCASAQQGPSLSRWHLACFTLASIWKNCFASASKTGASSAPVISQ